jgi:non-heme chloroperoxidase
MPLTIDELRLPGGLRLQYAEQGEPDGVPLLLLHGYGGSRRSFEPVLPHLPPSIHAIALTHRGHGDSDRPAGGYTTSALAGDAVATMDALGIESAVVVGHSMGGGVAQRIAIDHPDRVAGLVLAGAATSWADNGAVAELAADVVLLDDPVDPEFVRRFQLSTIVQPVRPSWADTVVSESLKLPARVWERCMEGVVLDDFAAELPSISAPTLLVWGDSDTDISPREEQDALMAAIPRSELLVYRGIGHALHWESPARFAIDVADFAHRC